MRVGDTVTIHHDPITREREEGRGIVRRVYRDPHTVTYYGRQYWEWFLSVELDDGPDKGLEVGRFIYEPATCDLCGGQINWRTGECASPDHAVIERVREEVGDA
jgi:hypothetical protein